MSGSVALPACCVVLHLRDAVRVLCLQVGSSRMPLRRSSSMSAQLAAASTSHTLISCSHAI